MFLCPYPLSKAEATLSVTTVSLAEEKQRIQELQAEAQDLRSGVGIAAGKIQADISAVAVSLYVHLGTEITSKSLSIYWWCGYCRLRVPHAWPRNVLSGPSTRPARRALSRCAGHYDTGPLTARSDIDLVHA